MPMRTFDYSTTPEVLLTAETMHFISAIHEYKGRQDLYLSSQPGILDTMVEIAKIQSTETSNRLEGIHTSNKRLREIMQENTDLRSRDEEEIAGYRDVLKTIHESYEYIDVTPNIILQLHRNLYRHTASSIGGHFKIGDNEIHGIRNDGTEYIRFKTVPAVLTPDAMERLCAALREGFSVGTLDPLLISLEFVFDFTCIHPFNDGNGRISRLLTLLLLYKSGYKIGRYVSLEKEIERTKGEYYDALAISSRGWENGTNDPGPFVRYMLGVILAAYRDFEDGAVTVSAAKLTKAERVEKVLQNSIGKITKSEIADVCPDISITTIERVLSTLLKTGRIRKVGGGRSTGYMWMSHAAAQK